MLVPFSFGLGSEDDHVPTFWRLTLTLSNLQGVSARIATFVGGRGRRGRGAC